MQLGRWDRALLAIAWPHDLRVKRIGPNAWYGEQFV